ncbi:MAG TPA: LytTR family transcriptional regulator DNA-binding domain-containing protein [Chitinophaga sp.]|uniref:LytR/AlgR family response regulator transcription factor n=1 Tax=Chitinophaga sp. TaxID=1869181 RepID=UPI002DB65A65|nr:LytTR family transcriptional regulator DNA-binding domain-containing protein [Chitinophaga sp.]HEU4551903.1 LytTR family transcriptional regulator DNA-binding domain-containing protein [Chitinophaga sp.]
MQPVKIMIVEDDPQQAALLQDMLEDQDYEVTGVADTLPAALKLFYTQPPDLVVIDVFLHGKRDGIAFATQINESGDMQKPFIFLTSAADRTTFDAARLTTPFSYLLKPFNELELQYAIELAIEKTAGAGAGQFTAPAAAAEKRTVLMHDFFFVKHGNTLAKIMLSDILYIEVEGKYCKIMAGREKYLVQQPLKLLLERLPEQQFIRVHRNYMVNIHGVVKVNLQENEMVLSNGQAILYSRRYLDSFLHLFDVLK